MSKKIFGQKKFSEKKKFGEKKFGLKKILAKKVFVHKKILFKKIFWLRKNFDPKCFRFLSKNLGRVYPGAGIYDPPPENSRVKIVWNCC